MSKNDLLTFEWDPKNEIIEIHGNKSGFKKLINQIETLLNREGNDHTHLMSSAWGGNELSEEKQGIENILINHVKVFKWDKSDPLQNSE